MANEQQHRRGVATDIREDAGPAILDPSIGLYKVPHTREAIFMGTMPPPGTAVEDNAAKAGVTPKGGARCRPGKLEPTAADESRLSSRTINAQGYTTPSPAELQNEDITVSGTRRDYPSVQECLEQMKLVPKLLDRIDEKHIDLMVKFGQRAVAFGGKVPIAQTYEKPSLFLRKEGIVTAEDVYLLLLIDVDIVNFEKNETLYLQWLVQDVRLPSGSPDVDVVNRLGREMVEYTPFASSFAGGVHGHLFLLYQQEKPLPTNAVNGIQREGFDAKSFIQSQKLEHPCPILAFYYETE